MKSFKSFIVLLLVAALLIGVAGCSGISRRSSRRDRDRDDDRGRQTDDDRDDDDDDDDDSDGGLLCETEFGTYTIGYDWVEVPSQSLPPYDFIYCEEGNENSSTPPNNLRVSHGSNFYSVDESEDFVAAILQQISGQAAALGGTAAMTEYGTFGENLVYRFDMDCEDSLTVQWYVVGDHEYVMFSLAVFDEDEAEDDHSMDVAEEAVYSFVWNR